jgi:hypothetical protein
MLVKFDNGWNSLPLSAQTLWSSGGSFPWSSLWKMSNGFPTWDSWATSFRYMWQRQVQDMERNLVYWRFNWKHEIGGLNAWRLPDVELADSSIPSDMSLAMEGYFLMKQFNALKEFGTRWRDEKRELWREIVDFWGFGDVLPDPPSDPPP